MADRKIININARNREKSMAAVDSLTFEGVFNNTTDGLFDTNATQAIESVDMRALVTAIRESYLNRIDDVLDEDDMASNSAAAVPTQQSVKAYVDAAALGIVTSWKAPVKVATTTAGTLATSFENGDTIDGVVLATGDRILIKDQSTQSENGIYIVAASGAPARSSDANVAAELEGAAVTVQQGTSNANTTWIQTTDGITLGSSNIVFAQLGASVPDASATVKGIVELATPAEALTATDTARAVTPEGLYVITVDLLSVSTAGATVTLDFASKIQRLFVGSASFSSSKTIALSNTTNALVLNLVVTITNLAGTVIFPSTFTMQAVDRRWDDSTHTFTPNETGKHEFSATWDGTDWNLKVSYAYS